MHGLLDGTDGEAYQAHKAATKAKGTNQR